MTTPKTFSLSSKEKAFCLALAKQSILYSLSNHSLFKLNETELNKVPKKLFENKACFVTLKLNNDLRGCIGHLQSVQPLYEDVIENAYSAAFSDSRFSPLTEEEFEYVKIEISILTDPIELNFKDPSDLLKKITPKKDGLILKKGPKSATFLPSVWEEIHTKEEFLAELCLKAGLSSSAWEENGMKVFTYSAIKI
ncbi:MAG: AmmeMemoRadiSam system protein A [archaeon]|jgi:AmmeMemoRadiSam system protein A